MALALIKSLRCTLNTAREVLVECDELVMVDEYKENERLNLLLEEADKIVCWKSHLTVNSNYYLNVLILQLETVRKAQKVSEK